jgi:drug/metabolite transporter (DMT)-like permease
VSSTERTDEIARARLMLVLISLIWGVNWPIIKIGIETMSPWTFRLGGFACSALFLIALVKLQGMSMQVPRGRIWLHIMASSLLNVVSFGLFSAFAQITAGTSRVAVVTYSFPVWASLLGWLMLGERLTRNAVIGLALCIAGLAVLLYPEIGSHALIGLSMSLACAIVWAFGTIYLKLSGIPSSPTITMWQVIFAFLVMAVVFPFMQDLSTIEPASWRSIAALVFNGIAGTGIAYAMWFRVASVLPAATASLGTLAVPVIGVVSSAILLGERPTVADWIGFALIFAAAACVIFGPRGRA